MKRRIHIQILLFCSAILFNSCKEETLSIVPKEISSESVVLIKTTVKIAIGGIVYENLDGQIRVKGYHADNQIAWTQDYNLTGPEDTLAVKNGFDHYSIELVNKWGINDIQSNIPGKDIWNGRVDGSLPVTYGFGGSKQAKRLAKVVTLREVNIPGTGIVYQPDYRNLYRYNENGQIESIHYEVYNPWTLQFEENRVETFTHTGKVVSKIAVTFNGQPYSDYVYEYGTLDKITETNYQTGIVTTQLIRRNYETSPNDSSVSILYNFSNGNSFRYDFGVMFKNIVSDRTRKSGETCNTGGYTYDKNINPFRHLGYVDFALKNWSASNKVSENVNFLACGYPTVIPLFYDYTYDQDGYPVKKITTYKSGSNQTSPYHTEDDFYYE